MCKSWLCEVVGVSDGWVRLCKLWLCDFVCVSHGVWGYGCVSDGCVRLWV